MAGAFLYAAHVGVDRQDVSPEREVPDCRSGVRPDAGELGEIVWPALGRDLLCGTMEIQPATVVAEPLPFTDHVRRRRCRERCHCRPPFQPGEITRNHALDLRLLQHHLRDEDRVRVLRPPPWQVASVLCKPGEQGGLHRPGL